MKKSLREIILSGRFSPVARRNANTKPNKKMTATELRNEISNCNQAIKAFKIGCPHLAPDGLSEAPSVKWLEMQKRFCIRKLTIVRNAQ